MWEEKREKEEEGETALLEFMYRELGRVFIYTLRLNFHIMIPFSGIYVMNCKFI